MISQSRIKLYCLMVATLPALWGCVYDHYADESPVDPQSGTDEVTYLQLCLYTGTASRATGGEEGDYREVGFNHENEIDNLTIFIYNVPDGQGLDGPADTPISFARRFGSSTLRVLDPTGSRRYTLPIPVLDYTPKAGDRVAVAVNTIDMSGVRTLDALRSLLVMQSYEAAATLTDCRSFAMASANNVGDYDGSIQMDDSHDGTVDQPFVAQVQLERLAARIDFLIPSVDAYQAAVGCICYPVAAANGSTVAHVYLTHILPVNVMHGGTYLLKRVTAAAPETPIGMATEPIRYCGIETTTLDGGMAVPTNYVMEPRTLLKAENVGEDLQAEWFGSSRAANINGNADAFTADYSVASLLASNGGNWLDLPHDGAPAAPGIIVSYADENTCHRSLQSASFITGLALRVVYQPSVVYADADLSTQLSAADFAPDPSTMAGRTIYRYCPDGISSVEDKCLYFSNEEAVTAYLAAHPTEHAAVQTFVDGVCYYNLWLSHATPASDSYTCPMQYAIVRNNIYRVSVAFTGPGVQPPEITDVKPGSIDCRIYVRKWNAWSHSEILI